MNGLGAHEGHHRTTGAGAMMAQSVADILGHRVVGFFREDRGQPLPSAALMSPMSRNFVAKLERFVAEHQIALVSFRRRERKDAGVGAGKDIIFSRERNLAVILPISGKMSSSIIAGIRCAAKRASHSGRAACNGRVRTCRADAGCRDHPSGVEVERAILGIRASWIPEPEH
jgi:hypothetical protein